MLRKLACLILLASSLLTSVACGHFNPYEHPVVPGVDDVKAAQAEMPSDAELSNVKHTVVIMPTQVNAGVNDPGIHGLLVNNIINAVNGAGRLSARAGGADMQRVIDELKLSGSGLFSPSGGAQVGKLLKARYVCWLTVNTMHGSIEANQWQDKEGKVYTNWEGEGNASVTLQMVDVETGEFVIQASESGTSTNSWDARPVGDHMLIMARQAAKNAVRDLEPVVGRAFPAMGYIQELRGERSVALIQVPGVTHLQTGTVVKVYIKRRAVDPRTGEERFNYVPIGSMSVRLVDQSGIWCSVGSGKEAIRLGHAVRSEGRGARGFLDTLFD